MGCAAAAAAGEQATCAELRSTMLHATQATQMPTPSGLPTDGPQAPVLGGEAWIMPYEPGAPAWITATAPSIRIVDRRPARAAATAR